LLANAMQFSSLLTNEAVLTEIGARLATVRCAEGLSAAALAARAGVEPAAIARAEAGETVSLGEFIGLLRALDLLDGLDGLLTPPCPPGESATTPAPPELQTGFVLRDNRSRHRSPGRRSRGPSDRRASGGPKPPGRFIWGDDPPPADA
jgi:transcriptional regulator with XRE-family HTH domain